MEYLDSLIAGAAILIAAVLVSWQVKRQFKDNRELQKQVERNKIWLQIFQEITQKKIDLMNAKLAATGFKAGVLSELEFAATAPRAGVVSNLKNRHVQQFLDLTSDLNSQIADLVILLEQYEIIKPGLSIFRKAFHSVAYDLLFLGMDLFEQYLTALPVEIVVDSALAGEKELVEPPKPSEETLTAIRNLSRAYQKCADVLSGFDYDLGVEIQNLLLGDLFEHRVPERQPLDPDVVVVSAAPEKLAKLEAHFEENTNWGMSNLSAKESVLHAIKK